MSATQGNSSSEKENQPSKPSEKTETNKPETEKVIFNPQTVYKPEEAYTTDFTEDLSQIVSFDSNENS
jgi:heme-binding NEAT domain protein